MGAAGYWLQWVAAYLRQANCFTFSCSASSAQIVRRSDWRTDGRENRYVPNRLYCTLSMMALANLAACNELCRLCICVHTVPSTVGRPFHRPPVAKPCKGGGGASHVSVGHPSAGRPIDHRPLFAHIGVRDGNQELCACDMCCARTCWT